MENRDFSVTLLLDQSPQEIFNAVKNVRAWWSATAKGNTANLHDEFMVDFGSHWWAFKIVEVVINEKMVWQVSGSYMPWNGNVHEWTDTTVHFEIFRAGVQMALRFTHRGLVPEFSCFKGCSKGWTGYMNVSLKNLIVTGIGAPDYAY
ncbi:SRPBCC domain-containing protein [Paradesertivirga mongoliensis]|uniref:SRPBCC domain-containing protein n=1 Tax=Paradesertivirga mongoliensis TaxID=2100740 RepID=A0ABW4ZME3_9SPHI|nr:SRPBCC domain-containing protein [Pedobacter mongoliensis]